MSPAGFSYDSADIISQTSGPLPCVLRVRLSDIHICPPWKYQCLKTLWSAASARTRWSATRRRPLGCFGVFDETNRNREIQLSTWFSFGVWDLHCPLVRQRKSRPRKTPETIIIRVYGSADTTTNWELGPLPKRLPSIYNCGTYVQLMLVTLLWISE